MYGVRRGSDLEVHHLIEQRFARRVLGLKPGDVPAVVLDRTFHHEVTAQLFTELPTRGAYSAQEIWSAYQRVYGDALEHWDWLEAIWPYFERLGVQR